MDTPIKTPRQAVEALMKKRLEPYIGQTTITPALIHEVEQEAVKVIEAVRQVLWTSGKLLPELEPVIIQDEQSPDRLKISFRERVPKMEPPYEKSGKIRAAIRSSRLATDLFRRTLEIEGREIEPGMIRSYRKTIIRTMLKEMP